MSIESQVQGQGKSRLAPPWARVTSMLRASSVLPQPCRWTRRVHREGVRFVFFLAIQTALGNVKWRV